MLKYEIINHGYMLPDYFHGCGVAFTPYTDCVTGCGDNAADAYHDAIDNMAQVDANSVEHMPSRPRGINKRDKVPAAAVECLWYVSICWVKE